MANWSDIKNLAEQLKRVQASESANCLSDRICVDIVSYLINSGRLQIYRTNDGRTLLTKNELFTEIIEELDAHRGRISLLELADNLEVEYAVVESHVHEMLTNLRDYYDEQCVLIAGELMTKSYIRRVAEEIRDRLEFRGVMTVTDFARSYNLSSQFLVSIINNYNGTLFQIQRDGDRLCTQVFISKQKAKVCGYLSAVVTPVSVADCAAKLDMAQKVLTSIIESLISGGNIKGFLTAERSIFTPTCYQQSQDKYITDFLKQNGYIDWNIVQRIGISDPSSYLRQRFPSAIHTKEFTINESVVSQIKSVLEDVSPDTHWIDVSNYLPQVFGAQEREWLIKPLIKKLDYVPVDGYMYLYPATRLAEHASCFDDYIRKQATVAALDQRKKVGAKNSGGSAPKNEESTIKTVDRNKGKTGGLGSRAREIKTKNVKKKYLKKNADTEEDGNQSDINVDSYLPREDLLPLLSTAIGTKAPEDLVECLLDNLLPQIHESFLSLVKSVYLQTADSSKNRDRCLEEKDSLISTVLSIQLLERGSLAVDDADLQTQLIRQLLRNEVSAFVNRLYLLFAQNYDIEWPKQTKGGEEIYPNEITIQQRDSLASIASKMAAGSVKEAASLLQQINACLRTNAEISESNGLPLDEVFSLSDDLASCHLGINLSVSLLRSGASKRKREDRLLALTIAKQTEEQMVAAAKSDDDNYLASVTLAGTALFAQCIAGCPVPVHGKLVPKICSWITKKLAKPPSNSSSYASAMNLLRESKASEKLNRLTEIVMLEAKFHGGESGVSKEEKRSLVDELVMVASGCIKAMQGGSPTPTA
nr:E3 UFM1 protein ligase 1 [Hymenolepis microstoma]